MKPSSRAMRSPRAAMSRLSLSSRAAIRRLSLSSRATISHGKRFEGIRCLDAERCKMSQVARKNGQTAACRRGRDGEVRKSGRMTHRTRPVHEQPGLSCRRNVERDHTIAIEVKHKIQPIGNTGCPGGRTRTLQLGNSVRYFRDGHRGYEQLVRTGVHPVDCLRRPFPPAGRPHRENVGIDQVHRVPYSAGSRGGLVSRGGMSSSFNPETVKRRPNEGTWRRRFHSSTPRITARGRPCRVMTDDSPFAAPSTSADSFAFASRN